MTQLTIFRVKQDVTDSDAILVEREASKDFPVTIDGNHLGVLYVKRSARTNPEWVGYFGGAIEIEDGELSTAAVAAVLLLAHNGHTYAVVFGYGRHLLHAEVL